MESIEKFTTDNSDLGVYFRIKQEYPLLDENLIDLLAFEELRNPEYLEKIRVERLQENELLKAQIENNENTINEDGALEHLTPLDNLIEFVDYTINDEIKDELLNSFSNLSVDVSNEYEHKVETFESGCEICYEPQ